MDSEQPARGNDLTARESCSRAHGPRSTSTLRQWSEPDPPGYYLPFPPRTAELGLWAAITAEQLAAAAAKFTEDLGRAAGTRGHVHVNVILDEDTGTTTVTLPPTLHDGCATDGGGGPITITSTRINAGPTLRATCSHGRTFVILNGAWEEVR